MPKQEVTEHYIFVKGKKYFVKKHIYKAYVSESTKFGYEIKKRKRADVIVDSLDKFLESGFSIADDSSFIAESVVENYDLKKALATLTDLEQKIVYLRFFEDKTLKKISVEISIPIETISRKLNKIMAKLKKYIKNQ